jgi:hypothetical protein
MEAFRVAVKNALTHYEMEGRAGGYQYVFVFLSDGADNRNTGVELTTGIEACGEEIRTAAIKSIILVVGVGSKSDTRIGT